MDGEDVDWQRELRRAMEDGAILMEELSGRDADARYDKMGYRTVRDCRMKLMDKSSMGAKVQFERDLHVAFSYKNVIAGTKIKAKFADSRLCCIEVTALKEEQNFSDFKQERMEGYEGQYEKENLKQTMLKHEEIFQGQVRELHHLYRVQKLLMDELRKNDFNAPKLSSTTSKTSPLMFQFKSQHMQLEGKSNCQDGLDVSMTEKDDLSYRQLIPAMGCQKNPSSYCLAQSIQIGMHPQETKDGSKDFYRLQSSKSIQRTFDLEQPVEEYMNGKATYKNNEDTVLRIEAKDTSKLDRSSNLLSCLETDCDVQLTLSTGWEKGKMECGKQTQLSLGLGFPEQTREQIKDSRHLIYSKETKLFPAASARPAATDREEIETQRVLSNQLRSNRGSDQEYIGNEDCSSEWKKLDESRKERLSLDLEIGEASPQENLKQPPWLLRVLSLNRT
eukprot:Gb_33289 [translate_table: standard]